MVTVLLFALVGVVALAGGWWFGRRGAYQRGVLAGQHQAELAHGAWHPADLGGSWNRPEPPRRKRSPDHQLVTRHMPASPSVWRNR